MKTLPGHTDKVFAVAWSPDGARIASTGTDDSVLVWSVVGQRPSWGQVGALSTGHGGSMNAVAWSPDSTRLASGSKDTTVQIWIVAGGPASWGEAGAPLGRGPGRR